MVCRVLCDLSVSVGELFGRRLCVLFVMVCLMLSVFCFVCCCLCLLVFVLCVCVFCS